MMYELYRTDTGRRVSVAVFFVEWRAWECIERITATVESGHRPDLAASLPYYSVRECQNPDGRIIE